MFTKKTISAEVRDMTHDYSENTWSRKTGEVHSNDSGGPISKKYCTLPLGFQVPVRKFSSLNEVIITLVEAFKLAIAIVAALLRMAIVSPN